MVARSFGWPLRRRISYWPGPVLAEAHLGASHFGYTMQGHARKRGWGGGYVDFKHGNYLELSK